MAYDKVVDSAVLDAGLKQIADAIREKAGVSGEFYFPTDFAEMIKAIQAGGGDVKVTCGVFIPTTDTEISGTNLFAAAIEHGLGELPNLVVVFNITGIAGLAKVAKDLRTYVSVRGELSDTVGAGDNIAFYSAYDYLGSSAYSLEGNQPVTGRYKVMTDTDFKIGGPTSAKLVAGHEYWWYAVGGIA